jgi:hypothetical protein
MRLHVSFKDKVLELPIGEGVRSLALADDLAVVDVDLAVVAQLPAGEILAVEKRNPAILVGGVLRRIFARLIFGVGRCNRCVSEDEFWTQLRFRIMGISRAPLGYCDWFKPKSYTLDGSLPRISGKIGFVGGPNVREFTFTLFLNHLPGSWEGIQWDALLPPDGADEWFMFDRDCGQIEMRPPSPVNPRLTPPA